MADIIPQFEFASGVARRLLTNTAHLEDALIVLTGDGPFDALDLLQMIPSHAEAHHDEVPDDLEVDLVILGRDDFEEGVIEEAFESREPPPRFLPQEAYLDEICFGHNWWVDHPLLLDDLIDSHGALAYAKSLFDMAFPWPTTQAPEATSPTESSAGFREVTELRQLGYQITGCGRAQRWRVLTERAIPELGLREVAETIANHCRVRRLQPNGRQRYRHALAEWEHDLRLLRERFWRGPVDFPWPSAES